MLSVKPYVARDVDEPAVRRQHLQQAQAGLALYTCNPDDFGGTPQLVLKAIAHPTQRCNC